MLSVSPSLVLSGSFSGLGVVVSGAQCLIWEVSLALLWAGLEDDMMATLFGRYFQVLLWELPEAPWSRGMDYVTLRTVG